MTSKSDIWKAWISKNVKGNGVPLFETDSQGNVQTLEYGSNNRRVLKRSSEMEELMMKEARKVVEDHRSHSSEYEGIIYMAYTIEESQIIPRYIGKAGRFKKDSRELSSNLESVLNKDGKFARWGYQHYYHLGDLSAVIFNHSANSSIGKYRKWAEELFQKQSGEYTNQLENEVYFWAKAWKKGDEGPYEGLHPYLAELEYQLIGLAYELFSERLLNSEGVPNNSEAFAKMKGWMKDEKVKLSRFES